MKTEYLLSVAYFIFLQRKGRAFVRCDQFFFREKSFFVDFLDIGQEKEEGKSPSSCYFVILMVFFLTLLLRNRRICLRLVLARVRRASVVNAR